MRGFLLSSCAYAFAFFFLAFAWYNSRSPQPDRASVYDVDYDRAALCVFERWDEGLTFDQQTRVVRFCIIVEPHTPPFISNGVRQ